VQINHQNALWQVDQINDWFAAKFGCLAALATPLHIICGAGLLRSSMAKRVVAAAVYERRGTGRHHQAFASSSESILTITAW
jgi:hypothetical protein